MCWFRLRRRGPLAQNASESAQGNASTVGSQCAHTWLSREVQVGVGRDSRKMHIFPIELKLFTKASLHVEPRHRRGSGRARGGRGGMLLRSWLPRAAGAAHANPGRAAGKPSKNIRKTKVFSVIENHTKSVCFKRVSVISQFHWCAKR